MPDAIVYAERASARVRRRHTMMSYAMAAPARARSVLFARADTDTPLMSDI